MFCRSKKPWVDKLHRDTCAFLLCLSPNLLDQAPGSSQDKHMSVLNYGRFAWEINITLAYFVFPRDRSLALSLSVGLLGTFGFRSTVVGFSIGQEGHTSQRSNISVVIRRPILKGNIFALCISQFQAPPPPGFTCSHCSGGRVFAQLLLPGGSGFGIWEILHSFERKMQEFLGLFQRHWRQLEKQVFLCCFISFLQKQ